MIDNTNATSDEDENVILMVSSMCQENDGTVEISSVVVTQKRNPPSCGVSVNDKNVKFLADSGSPFTLINMADSKKIDDMVVQESQIKMFAYGGKSIEVVLKFEAHLKFEGKCAVEMVYVVKEGENLLGWEEQGELGIILHLNHPNMV
ncbi:hypothetical protein NDU88_005637 [Pleurodeles waltl]|uniref:Peptidase A2 domain-containing protein n=1 Tax=Pleurodeles waltl TaxID=8319 RepID=A0AAV7WCF8_PLEWA|nr:hypothetical protein NDU88_005637 [Pleurodeles waltl]